MGNGTASIRSYSGDLSVQASTALLVNDHMTATNGDMVFNVGALTVTNTYLQADGELYLTVSNQITDDASGSPVSNIWRFGYGMYMPIKPATGDLLGTSITLTSPTNAEVDIIWPGVDMGMTTAGFTNNVAVGQLTLFGASPSSAFHFGASGVQNAIYINKLVLQGSTSNASAFDIDSNMKVYFGQAVNNNNVDISSVLTSGNSGFVQVPSFVGPFIASKPSPSAFSIPLAITSSGPPLNTPVVLWQAVPSAYNILYSTTDPVKVPWTVVTNILVGPDSYLISLPVTSLSDAASYYKLGVEPITP